MSTPILATKLFIPSPPPKVVRRPRLIERLNASLQRAASLTLISASAGSGKTTLLSEWLHSNEEPAGSPHPSRTAFSLHPSKVAWLSLDAGDNDPARFLAYLVAALRTIEANIGAGVLAALQAPQPPPIGSILTMLLNDLAALPDPFVLILDDYHLIEAKPVDEGVAFMLEHLPPPMRLIIATREDPALPLARLRALGRLSELRAADLRFTPAEAADFLNPVMGLQLSAADIAALEGRTEGWIAGLQLAALSLQGHADPAGFVQTFTGSHHFVLDYLLEEVLHQQSEPVQTFLLRTSILDRLCGPLCDALLLDPAASGQATLEAIERANLFIVPLDNDRRWYRYHHLFGDLLRQRLRASLAGAGAQADRRLNELHVRASQWYEDQGLDIEAFQHAAAAQDIDRAERLIEGRGIPLHLRGAVVAILNWLAALPPAVLNARPSLLWRYASLLLINGQSTGVEEKLLAAEAALAQPAVADDEHTRNLRGRIAVARATLALTRYQPEIMLAQSRRALDYLSPDNLALRANAFWTMGNAYILRGERGPARQAMLEAIALSQSSRAIFTTLLATIGLGVVQEGDNQLALAAETYQGMLRLAGDQPLQIVNEAHLGLARVHYEWNDLQAAKQHGQQALLLARQYDRVIDRFILCEVFLARLKLAQGDVAGAESLLAQADQSARQNNFLQRLPEVAAVQVLTLLRQGQLAAAARLAQVHPLPLSLARVHLAQQDPAAALLALAPWGQQAETRGWQDERLKVLVLQALAHQALGEMDQAARLLGDALYLAEPGGLIRTFIDEGAPMAKLLAALDASGASDTLSLRAYGQKLLAAFPTQAPIQPSAREASLHSLIEPLSPREQEVLQLIAQGLSNHEISTRLFLALDTVKGHNRRIYDKLHVQRRTEAVARARELGLL